MRSIVLIGVLGGVLAGCAAETGQEASSQTTNPRASAAPRIALKAPRVAELPRALSQIANLPDRGALLAYGGRTEKQGPFTMREVQLSEAHAISAIENGGMVVEGPDGAPIRLAYDHHVGHPNGDWTWVGRPAGAQPGTEAIITFGQKAVFGTIPTSDHRQVEISTRNGRTWMVQSDPNVPLNSPSDAGDADGVAMPTTEAMSKAVAAKSSQPKLASSGAQFFTSAAASPTGSFSTGTGAGVTVDLAIGYTSTFATRLGGTSQAMTRLNSMVDIANQAYANSQVGGKLRIARAVQVTYPDDTTNRSALMDLSGTTCTNTGGAGQRYLPEGGVNCTSRAVAAGLQPLIAARDAIGADLAILVRQFVSPANQSCGIGWIIGGAQATVGADSTAFGLSVVSDSSGMTYPAENGATCRQETLGHEVGHNLGLQHDRATAGGVDDTNTDGNALDPEEFGRYPYAFGHKVDANPGAFYDVMSVPTPGINQVGYRVFSNPRLATCGGAPCGIGGQTDASLAMGQTFPVVAAFRAPRFPVSGIGYRGDYNGDGRSDLVWHNPLFNTNTIWLSANSQTVQAAPSVTDKAWAIVGSGDFDGDGKSELLWRHTGLGTNVIWRSGNGAQAVALQARPDQAWTVAGIADFDGDRRADILWRNVVNGNNEIWRQGNAAMVTPVARVADLEFTVGAVADFNGDGRADILFRNRNDGRNVIWRSANAATASSLTTITSPDWIIVGAGDFDGDNKADILFRNARTGGNQIWRQADSRLYVTITAVASQQWQVVAIGDFNGDNKDDIMWRNTANGSSTIWRSANSTTPQGVTLVASQFWLVSG